MTHDEQTTHHWQEQGISDCYRLLNRPARLCQMIAQAGFNPLKPDAKKAIARIRRFHKTVAEHSARHFPTLVVNDGAVAYRDLSFRSRSVTHDFLIRSWRLFEAIRTEDEKLEHPGARLVLSCGFRMRGRRAGLDASRQHFESIISRLQTGEIDSQQAVHEAAAMRPRFDIVPQLQANFAFTKAYVAESSGTKGGLPGPNFYVDTICSATRGRHGSNWARISAGMTRG